MLMSNEFKKELHVFIINWIGHHLDPGEVFKKKTLDDWAKRNGYKKNCITKNNN